MYLQNIEAYNHNTLAEFLCDRKNEPLYLIATHEISNFRIDENCYCFGLFK
jgi:hypothetical protein